MHSPEHAQPHILPPHAWGNIHIYGMNILLAGWLTHADFRRKAQVLNAGAQTSLSGRTRLKNLFVPIYELNPLGSLLEKVRAWEAERSQVIPSS